MFIDATVVRDGFLAGEERAVVRILAIALPLGQVLAIERGYNDGLFSSAFATLEIGTAGQLWECTLLGLVGPRVTKSIVLAASGNVRPRRNGKCVAGSTRVEEDGFAGGCFVGCAGGRLR